MPENSRNDDVEKFLADQKSFEDRKQALIEDLLHQRDAALKAFDEKLAKLGYQSNSSGKTRRSHHRKAEASSAEQQSKPKVKG